MGRWGACPQISTDQMITTKTRRALTTKADHDGTRRGLIPADASVDWRAPVRDHQLMESGAAGRSEDATVLNEVNTWFAKRGFRIVPSAVDYSEQVRSSPWGKRAKSRDHHVWVDLSEPDGNVVSCGYGSGSTLADAAKGARRRWETEQEGPASRRPSRDLPGHTQGT